MASRKPSFGAHLSAPKKGSAWRKKIKVVTITDGKKKRKAYKVAGVDGWFMWANAKRAAKGLSTHKKSNSVRRLVAKGEMTAAEAAKRGVKARKPRKARK